MRYNELLEEKIETIKVKKNEITSEKIGYIVDLIINNCRPYLNENPQLLSLYRGINTFDDYGDYAFGVKNIRKDREPTDSSHNTHLTFNYLIKTNGKKANRSNSIFCSGSYSQAHAYGSETYVIFPVGTFNYTWLVGIKDWFDYYDNYDGPYKLYKQDEDEIYTKLYDTKKKKVLKNIEKLKINGDTDKIKKLQDYLDFDLNDLCKKVAKTQYHQSLDDLADIYNPSLINKETKENFQKYLRGDDGTLSEAISRQLEVMISCDQYIYVDTTLFDEKIHNLLIARM